MPLSLFNKSPVVERLGVVATKSFTACKVGYTVIVTTAVVQDVNAPLHNVYVVLLTPVNPTVGVYV